MGRKNTAAAPDLDPRILPLLAKHGLTPDQYRRQGRLGAADAWILDRRRALVTELHAAGTSWADMLAVTGLSHGSIQRLTGAMWNGASRKNVSEAGAANCRARKGEVKPWLTEQLRQQWADGKFAFHVGRQRTPEEIAKQKAAYTPEVRAVMSQKRTAYIQTAGAHDHQLFGIPEWMDTQKGGRILTRSSFERRAAQLLDQADEVVGFEFERELVLPNGKHILPDFLASMADGSKVLIEVKPEYVLRCYSDEHRAIKRLCAARDEALRQGWKFTIWTEVELGLARRKNEGPHPGQLPFGEAEDPIHRS